MKKNASIGSLIFCFLFIMYTNVCAAAATPIDHVKVSKSIIAVTVDGAETDQKTQEILNLCKQENIHLSFFSSSQFIAQNKILVKQAIKQGHEFGLSCVKRQYWDELRAEDIHKEMVIADRTLRQVAGKSVLMKPPYNYYGSTVLEAVKEYDPELKIIRGINTENWTVSEASPVEITKHIVSGDIVNFTLNSKQSLVTLKLIIEELKNKGFQIVTVSYLLAYAD